MQILYSYLLDRYQRLPGQLLANREEKCDKDDHVNCRTMEEKYGVSLCS